MPSTINKNFDIRQTNIAKGLACLFLLWHHLFFDSTKDYELFAPIVTTSSGKPVACIIAAICKVCVAMFLILSGYGMNCVLNNNVNPDCLMKSSINISLKQLWKLWANYIFIFVLFVPWQFIFNHMPYTCWQDCVVDILGVSYIFLGKHTMNATWWYMSIAILSYIVTPIFYFLFNKNRGLTIILMVTAMGLFAQVSYIYWVVFYFCGFILCEYRYFDIIASWYTKMKALKIIGMIACIGLIIYFRRLYNPLVLDLPLAVIMITLSYLFLSKIKLISGIFGFIGKHSGNIFMFHTFIYYYDFQSIIYAPRYSPLIFLLLLLICLGVSVLIEILKKSILFSKFVEYVGNSIVSPKRSQN